MKYELLFQRYNEYKKLYRQTHDEIYHKLFKEYEWIIHDVLHETSNLAHYEYFYCRDD